MSSSSATPAAPTQAPPNPSLKAPVSAAGRFISSQCAERRCEDCTQHEARPAEPQNGIAFDPCTHDCHRLWPATGGGR
ncbi:hypothetical protein [Streptomyces hoynatensis]|uniref:Uncharacterized protein n=1 Tax=Streptomyces hoynatensis TaxID=1141874 RepID=A0A3A9YVW8_9ACTN|nr:hypothetical protein [Streptomyces hoynatensis]RKN39734.1 hypothetical protein D7294_20035 [Streptomyces hoynatensis]